MNLYRVFPFVILNRAKNLCPVLAAIFLAGLYVFLIFASVQAAEIIMVAPAVIDLKAKPRDILKDKIILENKSDAKLNIYPFVNNILADSGEERFLNPAAADQSSSLANWISISRGVLDLSPGEKKEMDFLIEVNMRAKPGIYHAVISFAAGATRDAAEADLKDAGRININLEVLDNAKEALAIKKFMPDKNFFSKFPVSIFYTLENSGDRPILPTGRIRIYNRRGEEVSVIELNSEAVNVEPQTSEFFKVIWPDGKVFGRYKALLDIEYGTRERKILYDAIFFWVIPWQKLLILFGGIGILPIIFIFWRQKRMLALQAEENS